MKPLKVLITGGSGFIGSNLVDKIVNSKNNYEVFVIDHKDPEYINNKVRYENMDITSNKLDRYIKKLDPEIVIHLAAQASVAISSRNPVLDSNVNISGSLNLLKSSIESGVKKFVFFSTGGAIYGENIDKEFSENDIPDPKSPYGISKYSFEIYLNYLCRKSNIKNIIIRPSNVFGPRQNPDGEAGVISIFGKKMIMGEAINIFGTGKEYRDYIYVNDVVNFAYMSMKEDFFGTFNVCSGKTYTTLDIFNKLSELTRYEKKPIYQNAREGDILGIKLDNTKALDLAKWKPETSFSNGLIKTLDFLKL
jgi:UDP-glucose 4-epimerase